MTRKAALVNRNTGLLVWSERKGRDIPTSAVASSSSTQFGLCNCISSARASGGVVFRDSGFPKAIGTRRARQACPIDQYNSTDDSGGYQNPPAGAVDIMQPSG